MGNTIRKFFWKTLILILAEVDIFIALNIIVIGIATIYNKIMH